MAVWKLWFVGIKGRTLRHLRGLVWWHLPFPVQNAVQCQRFIKWILQEFTSCHVVTSACELSVHCKLCIMSYSVLYNTHTPYPRLTPVQPAQTSEPTANAKRLFCSTRTSLVSVKYEHYQQQQRTSLKSYKMQPVDLTLSMTELDWGGNYLRGSRRVV